MIDQISVVAVIRDGVLEAVVYQNGGNPVIYKTEKMDVEMIKDLLESVNKETLKI